MLSTIPSRRHSSAIAYSPRRPDNTIRIFSSAEYRLRVARRISRTCCSAVSDGTDFCLIFAPSRATMSQKSSLRKIPQSVSQLLTGNTNSCVVIWFRQKKGGLPRGEVTLRPPLQGHFSGDGDEAANSQTRNPLICSEKRGGLFYGSSPQRRGNAAWFSRNAGRSQVIRSPILASSRSAGGNSARIFGSCA